MAVTFLLFTVIISAVSCQVPIPNKPLGWIYNKTAFQSLVNVNIELYLDLACPDSKAAFPVLQKVRLMYSDKQVQLKILVFPLPYHRNAYTAAVGADAAYENPLKGKTAEESAFLWTDKLFERQISWSNGNTNSMSQAQIVSLLAGYAGEVGYDVEIFKKYLTNSGYDWNTRVMWKYACTRGVAGTPWYIINGVTVDASEWSVSQWQGVIDELLSGRHIIGAL